MDGGDVILKGLQLGIADFGNFTVVALALGAFSLILQVLYFLFVLLDLVYQLALTLPLGTEQGFLLLQFGNILIQLGNFRFITLSLNRFALDFELG